MTRRGGGLARELAAALLVPALAAALLASAPWGTLGDAAALGSSSHPFSISWGQSGPLPGQFKSPQGVAAGPNGGVYVTDLGNARVQKFGPDGAYLLSWGGHGTGAGQFKAPAGIAVGAGSTVYVVDGQQGRVQMFSPEGEYLGQWGGPGSSPGRFVLPSGIDAGPDGRVYVADTGNRRVQVFEANGTYVSELGRGQQPPPGAALLSAPLGVAVDSAGSTVYVSDPSDNSIKAFGTDGALLATYDASVGGMDVQAHGLAAAPFGGLYVADPFNNRVILLDESGTPTAAWGSEGIRAGQFKMPADLAVSGPAGLLYVADSNGHRIQAFSLPAEPAPAAPGQAAARPSPAAPAPAPAPVLAAADAAAAAAAAADLEKPVVTAPADLTVEATGALTPVSIGQAVASDASGIRSLESNAPEQFTLGTSTVIWTAIDGAGNMAVATQKVIVRDTVPPVIGGLPDVAAEAAGPGGTAVELAEPPVTDAVGIMSIASDAPDLFALGATAVTWTARDVVGNEATAVQTVVVSDTADPSIRAPPDVTFEAESADSNAVPLGEAEASDGGSGVASVTNDAPPSFRIGQTTVTWRAIDAAGNEASAAQLVRVVDTTPPAIEAPPDVTSEAESADSNAVRLGSPSVSDAQAVSVTSDAPDAFALGTHKVTWNATDASGNSAAAEQLVHVVDTTPPSVEVPPAVTAEAESASGAAVPLGQIVVGGGSGGGAVVTPIASVTNDAPAVFRLGTTVVTWTVTDEAGNTATAVQEVTVRDTVPPSVSAPPDAALEAESAGGAPAAGFGSADASDAVGVASIESDAPPVFPIGTTAVTWTASDAAGNTATARQSVTVRDTVPPSVSAPPDAAAEAASPAGAAVDIGAAEAADAVGVASIESDAPPVFPIGTTVVTWTASDAAGNTATARQSVTVRDTVPPSLAAPPAVRAEASGERTEVGGIGTAAASDAVGVVLLGSDAPLSYPIGDTVVTWTAADAAGNAAQAQQTVAVRDTVPPSVSAPPDVTAEAASPDANSVDIGAAEAADAVGVASLESDAPDAFKVGNTVVTWTAADEAGNEASDSHVVSVVDTTPPAVYAPDSVLAEAAGPLGTAVDHGRATASDAVGVVSVASDAPPLFGLGTTVVTWTAADAAGNTMTAGQEVTVADTTPPSLRAPPDVAAEADSPAGAAVDIGAAEAADAVGVASLESDAPPVFPIGTTVVTWTASDAAGNAAAARQSVEVRDTTPPSIVIPAPITLEASAPGGYPVGAGSLFELPASSDLAGPVTLESDAPPVLPLGATVLTWTAADAAGNTATAAQEITVRDTVPPSLRAPPDVAAEADSPDGAAVDIGAANATDAVGVASIESDAPPVFPIGTTAVTWTASDAAGNTATARQSVEVRDTTPPLIEPPRALELEADSAAGYDSAAPGGALAPPAASDAAGPVTLENDAPPVLPIGATVVTWTASDAAGNAATARQSVEVRDTTPPILAAPANVTAEADSPAGAAVDIGAAEAADAVGVASIESDAPPVFPIGTTVVTWTASDAAGNAAAARQSVEVRDTTPPSIVIPAPITLEASAPGGYPVGAGSLFELPASSDLAGPVTLESDAPPVLPLGATVLTWTAADAAGNTATAAQEITVRDTVPPSLRAPPDVAAEADSPAGAAVDIGAANATDAVGVASIESDAPPVFPIGTTAVTWTASDAAGNTATARQSVEVRDTTPPLIEPPRALELEADSAAGYDSAAPGGALAPPAASDAAGPVTLENDAPPVLPIGATVVTWTASDAAGNAATARQSVEVRDTTPPILAAPANVTAEADSPAGAAVDIGAAEAADAVGVASIESDAPPVFPIGTTVVTWTASDAAGNAAAARQSVEVRDTTPPSIVIPAPITLEASAPGGYPVGAGSLFELPASSDLAGPVTLESDAPPVLPLGATVLTWTAADAAGNTATAAQEITVRDTVPPSLRAPANITADATGPETAAVLGTANATDLVDPSPAVESDAPSVFPIGTTAVTWSATDAAGNRATAAQSVAILACGRPHAQFNVITGTAGDDVLSGTAGDDLVFALAGDDVILAGPGDDCILAGPGDDVIRAQSGSDDVRGGPGSDVIDGGPGSDTCSAAAPDAAGRSAAAADGSGDLATNCEQ